MPRSRENDALRVRVYELLNHGRPGRAWVTVTDPPTTVAVRLCDGALRFSRNPLLPPKKWLSATDIAGDFLEVAGRRREGTNGWEHIRILADDVSSTPLHVAVARALGATGDPLHPVRLDLRHRSPGQRARVALLKSLLCGSAAPGGPRPAP
jgi:hypothetical protein